VPAEEPFTASIGDMAVPTGGLCADGLGIIVHDDKCKEPKPLLAA